MIGILDDVHATNGRPSLPSGRDTCSAPILTWLGMRTQSL